MALTEKAQLALEDAVFYAIEADADYDDILSEVTYLLDTAREDGELA